MQGLVAKNVGKLAKDPCSTRQRHLLYFFPNGRSKQTRRRHGAYHRYFCTNISFINVIIVHVFIFLLLS